MKINRKAKKVHPSPPQTAASTLNSAVDESYSSLKLLPAAIFAIITVLSFQDREVLAYMINRSMKTTTVSSINTSSPLKQDELKKKKTHKSPAFDCECFECYTSFWLRWDSSPNREVIHQAIEAFEEHLASGELEVKRSSSNRRGKKKEKEKPVTLSPVVENDTVKLPAEETVTEVVAERQIEAEIVRVATTSTTTGHKGFVRKVLPDVLGVLNSRLWNLWGPNV